jgi:serine protease SohB
MSAALLELALFAAKTFVILIFIVLLLVVFIALIAKGKKHKGRLIVKNLNEKYHDIKHMILEETLPKKMFKKFLKQSKAEEKAKHKQEAETKQKNIYVLHFHGDIKASAVEALREEINAILQTDAAEVIVKIESAGGVVHGYGLAAAQLMRLREKNIPLTVCIDKVAASGGYMMACIANKILAAPFAIIGSIGVIVQLPNFHRVLEDKHIDFEQFTAGEFKRTVTLFGKNTPEGRQKLQEEIEEVHQLFKNLIKQYRADIDLPKVATGEHWVGLQALQLKLIDAIQTSDDYVLSKVAHANVYEICYEMKKSFLQKLSGGGAAMNSSLFNYLKSRSLSV